MEIASHADLILRGAIKAEAKTRAATATECDPIEIALDVWDDIAPLSVKLAYCNRGQVETQVDICQDYGDGCKPMVTLSPDDLPRLIAVLLAASKAIKELNDAAKDPDTWFQIAENERACKGNPSFLEMA
jgi:hypothetical protein